MSAPQRITDLAPGADASYLDHFEYRFRLRGEGPQPLSVDGRRLGHGLPRRQIPLTELSSILTHPSCGAEAKDAVWRLLARQARAGSDSWVVGAVGVALPGLRKAAYRLWLLSAGDVEATVVSHFYQALLAIDLHSPWVFTRLLNVAFSRTRSELDKREPGTSGEVDFVPASRPPAPPYDHPDFVLLRAVQLGVLSVPEAELIGATYLDKLSVSEYAERLGRTYWQVYRQRGPAVQRLVTAINDGTLSDPYTDVITEATLTTAAETTRPANRP
ncbi:hypothetical protein GCM10020358_58270 [Amorphoplanes nipponensis]|uniref:Uncharacterized protein n=2 Tax=Actinoplanes nipponensis TaxID=135950 RepID=A0A919JK89_9ACTN|nr:sigma-70 family RNA polymerase sigma factor [Actinoplanes nipponensis]GIE52529.1 hypothetical protein Ani05nite_60630 [Actinoplanes nipponensis]